MDIFVLIGNKGRKKKSSKSASKRKWWSTCLTTLYYNIHFKTIEKKKNLPDTWIFLFENRAKTIQLALNEWIKIEDLFDYYHYCITLRSTRTHKYLIYFPICQLPFYSNNIYQIFFFWGYFIAYNCTSIYTHNK